MNDQGNMFYTLPLRLDGIIEKKHHPSCTLQESIAQNLYLLITTSFNELRYDYSYGCSIWEQDFEILANTKWKDMLSNSLEGTIRTHEGRLSNTKVNLDIEEYRYTIKDTVRIKRKLVIRITGYTSRTNEKFEFAEQIFIAPFSLD